MGDLNIGFNVVKGFGSKEGAGVSFSFKEISLQVPPPEGQLYGGVLYQVRVAENELVIGRFPQVPGPGSMGGTNVFRINRTQVVFQEGRSGGTVRRCESLPRYRQLIQRQIDLIRQRMLSLANVTEQSQLIQVISYLQDLIRRE